MNINSLLEAVTIILIALGTGLLIYTAFQTRQIMRLSQDAKFTRNWQIVMLLILFFLVGYPAALVSALMGSSNLLLISIEIIFFFGAFFVYRQTEVSFTTIRDLLSGNTDLKNERTDLEGKVASKASQLTAVNEIGRALSAILDPEELIREAVNQVNDRFGYYYTAVFLVDPAGRWAQLEYATGEAGRVLKENQHRLEVGGKSMVGTAISTQLPRVAQVVATEPVRYENPLLPYTRSEIAIPLIVGDNVIGALDAQSIREGTFVPQEVEALQSLTRQIAISIENARVFQDLNQNLEEMRSVQKQYVLASWKPTLEGQGFEYNASAEDLLTNSSQLEIPLSLRDEIIGRINLAGEGVWTPEQRNLIEAVATQAALALENARLLEESQSSASRDRLMAEITGKIWTAPTIDGILQVAVRELGGALEATEATIELRVEE
jgi:GAF domain-containing protein